MTKLQLAIAKAPVLGRLALTAYRAKAAAPYFRGPLASLVRWMFTSKEVTNFTYDLEEANKRYMASLIAFVLDTDLRTILGYVEELEEDEDLKRHILRATAQSELAFLADSQVRFGRRIGWYAFARATKPRVVVETGVEKGLGACVLAAALKRNTEEGHEGRYCGTDIDPRAGYLLSGQYAAFGTILYGDSIESLKRLDETVDLFVNDSDHSAEYEAEEYATIAGRLSADAIVLGDNSHCTDKLFEFAQRTGRRFVFFQEKPAGHWYPGGGIGICFKA
jgi:hypothetical protein